MKPSRNGRTEQRGWSRTAAVPCFAVLLSAAAACPAEPEAASSKVGPVPDSLASTSGVPAELSMDRWSFTPLSRNQALAELVAAKLREGHFRGFDIEIRVEDGEVTLTGGVSSVAVRETAACIVSAVDGVRTIDNQLTVDHKLLPPTNQAVAETVANAISQSFAVFGHRTCSIEIFVEGSGKSVTLRGFVNSAAARDTAIRAAKRVPGVGVVISRLDVVPIHKKPPLELAARDDPIQPVEAPRPQASRNRDRVAVGRAMITATVTPLGGRDR